MEVEDVISVGKRNIKKNLLYCHFDNYISLRVKPLSGDPQLDTDGIFHIGPGYGLLFF